MFQLKKRNYNNIVSVSFSRFYSFHLFTRVIGRDDCKTLIMRCICLLGWRVVFLSLLVEKLLSFEIYFHCYWFRNILNFNQTHIYTSPMAFNGSLDVLSWELGACTFSVLIGPQYLKPVAATEYNNFSSNHAEQRETDCCGDAIGFVGLPSDVQVPLQGEKALPLPRKGVIIFFF